MSIKRILIVAASLFLISSLVRAEEDKGFRFAVMGCAHMGLCEPKDYEIAAERIKEYNPDFVIYLGSMVDNVSGPEKKEYDIREAFKRNVRLSEVEIQSRWREFDNISARLGVPIYDVPSERNIPANNVKAAEEEFLKRYKNRFYSFAYKNNLFICLDSESHNRLDHRMRGFIAEKQFDFLKQTLRDSNRYDNAFIFLHQSAWQPPFSKESRWFSTVQPLIDGKVKYVFGACLHFIDFKKIGKVNYVTSGSARCWLDPVINPAFPHFLIVDVIGKDVSVRVVPIGPIPIERLVVVKSEKKATLEDFLQKARLLAVKICDKINRYIVIGESKKSQSSEDLLSKERLVILQPEKIIKALDIRPDMTIVDIGAGKGLLTFLLADRLRGTGQVFATDVSASEIDYLKGQSLKGKYKNIFPVLVNRIGLDGFYKKHKFDIIFLCDTFEMIYRPEQYLSELRPSLKGGTGRLYIIYFKGDPEFQKVEFGDFKVVMQVLREKGEDFPVFKRLHSRVKDFVRHWNGGDVPDKIQEGIVRDFNAMLFDGLLFKDLLDYYADYETHSMIVINRFISPKDIRLVQFLFTNLEKNRVFDAKEADISERDRNGLHKLNRSALQGIFHTQIIQQTLLLDFPLSLEKNRLIFLVESAGYKLVREYDILPMHFFLEFKSKD